MPDSLHFTQVQPAVRIPKDTVDLMAILRIHEAMPKDERGVSTICTIREMVCRYAPGIDPLSCDYACAFGKQGQAVITKYVQRLGVDNSEFERKISARVDAILTDLSRR